MEAFVRIQGIAAPLLQANVDTDQIIPTRFLTRLTEEGLGEGLFAEWRAQPGFLLDEAPWDRAQILVAGANFGCGSSREAAPRALRQRGFRALIAPSFGDIFYGNCFRNGIAPVVLPAAAVQSLGERLLAGGIAGRELAVDLEKLEVRVPGGDEVHAFDAPPLLRQMLLEGLDEVDLTLRRRDDIARFRETDRRRRPWAYL